MKRSLHISFEKAGLITLFLFVLQGISFAGLAVSPLKQNIEVKPGKKVTFSIILGNNKRSEQTQPCHVRLEVIDFSVSDNGKLSFGKEYAHKRSAVNWIQFEETDFVLQPDESREMKATVTAPVDADGDYWAAVMIKQVRSNEDAKGVSVNFQTASGVFIHVARRNYIERGSIADANVILPEFAIADSPAEKTLTEPNKPAVEKKPLLEVKVKVKNDGLIEFLARGKAYIYSKNNRRIATIPLYASRSQVLPGDSRWFDGLLAQPLPAGQYKLRVFFGYDSGYSRQITKDMAISISDDMARVWADKFVNDDAPKLSIKPQLIELTLAPGRLTTANFKVENLSLATIAVNCKVECDGKYGDWLELKTTDFSLAPATQRSATCVVKIPSNTKAGEYKWTIFIEMERSGLNDKGQSNIERYQVPVHVVVSEPAGIIPVKNE